MITECRATECETLARGGEGYCSTHWDLLKQYGTITPNFSCTMCYQSYVFQAKISNRKFCPTCAKLIGPLRHKRTLMSKHNLTVQNYVELGDAQAWACKLCFYKPITDKWPDCLTIDHDHSCCHFASAISCGRCIRAMLCNNCNTMLGHYQKCKGSLVIPEFDHYLALPLFQFSTVTRKGSGLVAVG